MHEASRSSYPYVARLDVAPKAYGHQVGVEFEARQGESLAWECISRQLAGNFQPAIGYTDTTEGDYRRITVFLAAAATALNV